MSARLQEIAGLIDEVLSPVVDNNNSEDREQSVASNLRRVFDMCLQDIGRLEAACASLASQCERLEGVVGAQSAELEAMRERSGSLNVDLHRLQSLNSFHNSANLRLHSLSLCGVGGK